MEHEETPKKWRFGWMELLLIVTVLVLVLQLFPAFSSATFWALNPRNWPRTAWFYLNLTAVLMLMLVRLAPQLYEDWKARKEERVRKRQKVLELQELKQQRRALDKMKASRDRRIY